MTITIRGIIKPARFCETSANWYCNARLWPITTAPQCRLTVSTDRLLHDAFAVNVIALKDDFCDGGHGDKAGSARNSPRRWRNRPSGLNQGRPNMKDTNEIRVLTNAERESVSGGMKWERNTVNSNVIDARGGQIKVWFGAFTLDAQGKVSSFTPA
jgi:hypothetical protein